MSGRLFHNVLNDCVTCNHHNLPYQFTNLKINLKIWGTEKPCYKGLIRISLIFTTKISTISANGRDTFFLLNLYLQLF